MDDFRCTCKKLLFKIDGDTIVIKCRHCKRLIYIHTKGLVDVEFKLNDSVCYMGIS